MSRTDKDVPFKYRESDYVNCGCDDKWPYVGQFCRVCLSYRNFGPFNDSNFRKGRKALKREGNKRFRRSFKQPRYSRCSFYDYKTVRTNNFFY